MNENIKKRINAKKVFYVAILFALMLFIIGWVAMSFDSVDDAIQSALGFDFLGIIMILIPFSMSAWIIILGTIFVKKDPLVVLMLLLLAIPHVIVIAVSYGLSYTILDILKVYSLILSFGILGIFY